MGGSFFKEMAMAAMGTKKQQVLAVLDTFFLLPMNVLRYSFLSPMISRPRILVDPKISFVLKIAPPSELPKQT